MYHIACSTDNRYINHCTVMLSSLMDRNRDIPITIHVLIDGLNEKNQKRLSDLSAINKNEIIFHHVDVSKLQHVKYRQNKPLSVAAYYRLLLASILPDIDQVLYLDVDMVIMQPLSDLLNTDIQTYPLAAVADAEQERVFKQHRKQLHFAKGDIYFNSGLLLINLKYWREHDCEVELIRFAEQERHVYFHDQDALNFVFKNNWLELPGKYNKFHLRRKYATRFRSSAEKKEYRQTPVIIHFSGGYIPENKIIGIRYEQYYLKYYNMYCGTLPPCKLSYMQRIWPLIYDICEMVKRKCGIKKITLFIRQNL